MEERIKRSVRGVPNFPIPGVEFKDLSPIIADPYLLSSIVGRLAYHIGEFEADKVIAVDARGFVFGTPAAVIQGVSLHLARKKGKLPWKTVSHQYELEYGSDCLELHEDAIEKGDRVVVIDDLLATGGTVNAVNELVRKMGGTVVANCFVVELSCLKGRERLDTEVISLAKYD